ncbi:15-hydroxyprostaglandin dehydrogenase [NAD(+)]-like [Anticarsia gemmatalis]|uniref:15-hydroxyprostaglandin dehydrogenase [NAD(+)]-like n=1 Tax=Anticarsia gemmatalis TaxID=129554 RepID=UPI003F75AE0A
MQEISGKVVLITGAANGIGAEFVKILVEQGAKHVRVLDIDDKAGVSLQDELNAKYGKNKVKFTKCDVSIDEQLLEAFNRTIEEFGYIDVVVNNAGVTNESNSEYRRKEVDINITALVNGTIKAIELMRKDKGGKGGTVINVSSVAALVKFSPLLFVYAATKFAVMRFSNCIGKEPYHTKTGVRVLAICYGPTQTGIFDKMASFDEDIKVQDLLGLLPLQNTETAARETLEAFRKGESGSTWLIHNSKPAKDISVTVDKAYTELSSLLQEE